MPYPIKPRINRLNSTRNSFNIPIISFAISLATLSPKRVISKNLIMAITIHIPKIRAINSPIKAILKTSKISHQIQRHIYCIDIFHEDYLYLDPQQLQLSLQPQLLRLHPLANL